MNNFKSAITGAYFQFHFIFVHVQANIAFWLFFQRNQNSFNALVNRLEKYQKAIAFSAKKLQKACFKRKITF